jgi:hypothetical protein
MGASSVCWSTDSASRCRLTRTARARGRAAGASRLLKAPLTAMFAKAPSPQAVLLFRSSSTSMKKP